MTSEEESASSLAQLDMTTPDWRSLKHPNGAPMFSPTGTLLDDQGNRSIFDDVDS